MRRVLLAGRRWASAPPCCQAPTVGSPLRRAAQVELIGVCPPIEKMDSSLNALKACRHLALSTNSIDKIGSLTGLERLEILSLGRNQLKKLENLDGIAATIRELWLSYNQIDRLVRTEWGALRLCTPSQCCREGSGGRRR